MTDAALTATAPTRGTYLTEKEASGITKFAQGTLRNMRSAGRGPKFLRVGGAIRYRLDDLVAWMEGDGA